MQSMINQMCKTDLSDSDIKAICKSRGFPEKEAASRDVFENFFISTIGVKEVLNSLAYEEILFLHFLNKINKEVDIEYFERLYGCAQPGSGFYSMTFNQQYQETFKKVKNNLVRRGVLIMIEEENRYASTRMERWRFRFPPEFAEFLPPLVKASKFNEKGDFKKEILRDKLLEIIGKRQKSSGLSGEKSLTIAIKDGDLYIGTEMFKASHLLKWQQTCWKASIEIKTSIHEDDMTPVEVILYTLSHLKEQEWLPADALSVLLKIFIGKEGYRPENICESGWEWGCLVKLAAGGKTYYRLPEDILEYAAPSSPENYLHIEPDGAVILDMMTIPYAAVEVIASSSILERHDSTLRASVSLIKIGNALSTFQKNNVFEWLKENSSGYRTATETAQKRWGKQIIHENLMIARVKDLSLKVMIQNSFVESKNFVSLPDDYIVFPCDKLPIVQQLVEKSGHVIKKAVAK